MEPTTTTEAVFRASPATIDGAERAAGTLCTVADSLGIADEDFAAWIAPKTGADWSVKVRAADLDTLAEVLAASPHVVCTVPGEMTGATVAQMLTAVRGERERARLAARFGRTSRQTVTV